MLTLWFLFGKRTPENDYYITTLIFDEMTSKPVNRSKTQQHVARGPPWALISATVYRTTPWAFS